MKTSWFLTPPGRAFSKVVAFAGTAGGFLAYYLPNNLLIDQYKQVTQLYKAGIPVRLSPTIPPLVEEAMNDLQLSEDKRDCLSLYTSCGFDLFRAGTFAVSPKAVLGVPISFKYENLDQFITTGIMVNNEPVKWSTTEAQSLKESLVFSDDAKRFALARELSHLELAEPYKYGVVTSAIVLMHYTVTSTINSKYELFTRPKSLRMVMYGIMSLFSCTLWILFKDMTCVSDEKTVDTAVANISEKYAKAGLEYYEKVLQRNIALRALMGERGQSSYTAFGNDQVLIRTKHMPFTTRRDNMKSRFEEYVKAREESATTVTSEESPTKSGSTKSS